MKLLPLGVILVAVLFSNSGFADRSCGEVLKYRTVNDFQVFSGKVGYEFYPRSRESDFLRVAWDMITKNPDFDLALKYILENPAVLDAFKHKVREVVKKYSSASHEEWHRDIVRPQGRWYAHFVSDAIEAVIKVAHEAGYAPRELLSTEVSKDELEYGLRLFGWQTGPERAWGRMSYDAFSSASTATTLIQLGDVSVMYIETKLSDGRIVFRKSWDPSRLLPHLKDLKSGH